MIAPVRYTIVFMCNVRPKKVVARLDMARHTLIIISSGPAPPPGRLAFAMTCWSWLSLPFRARFGKGLPLDLMRDEDRLFRKDDAQTQRPNPRMGGY
jgi:hypothetical protein